MAGELRIHLLGAMEIWHGKTRLALPGSMVARSLLAYLCLLPDKPVPRQVLLGLFWPDLPEKRARRALSQAIWHIRRVLPQAIITERESIAVRNRSALQTDVQAFETQTRLGLQPEPADLDPERRLALLRDAADLYRGDLLEGIYHDWVLMERERLRDVYLHTLATLVQLEKQAGRYPQALEYAQRMVGMDPLLESGHREIMRLQLALGRREAALQQYQVCRQVLEEQFGLEPEAETRALVRELAQDPGLQQSPYLPVLRPARPPLVQTPRQALHLPLVGRQAEREILLAGLEDLSVGHGGILLLEGVAGIGKTRLVEELARDAEWRGFQALWGYCQEQGSQAPFGPVAQALRSGMTSLRASQLQELLPLIYQQVLAGLFPALCSQGIPASEVSPSQSQQRFAESMAALLSAWGQITPLVLVLEDLHWATADTMELLVSLARQVRGARVLLLITYRGEEARSTPKTWQLLQEIDRCGALARLSLSGLQPSACSELVRRALRLSQPAPLFEERLHLETNGNPLFLIETIRTLLDEEILCQDAAGHWQTPWDSTTADYAEIPLPPVVERTIARRLVFLPDHLRQILQQAAVFGEFFEYRVLQDLLEMEAQALLMSLHELVQRRYLVEQPNGYRFAHDKIRQVVYLGLAAELRRSYHARAVAVLQARYPDHLAELAHHAEQGALWPQALKFSQQAGDQALALYAHQEAEGHYSRALRILAENPELVVPLMHFDLHLARCQAFERRGERRKQRADLDVLQSLSSQPGFDCPTRQVKLARAWVDYYHALSDYPAALQAVEELHTQALAIREPKILAETLLIKGQLLQETRAMSLARQQYQRAYELASANQLSEVLPTCLHRLAWMDFEIGEFDQALEIARQALDCFPAGGNSLVLSGVYNLMGTLYQSLADFPRAEEYHLKAIDLRRAAGDRRLEAGSLYNLSLVYSDGGNHPAAREMLLEVCRLARQLDSKNLEAYGQVFLGFTLEHLGEFEAARQAYQAGLGLRNELGQHAMANDALAGLARVATAQGQTQLAVAYAHQVLDWIEANGTSGIGDPLLAYVGVYRALFAAGEPERQLGLQALTTAYQRLLQQADNISDPERRRAFLHDISPGKSIWQDYQVQIAGHEVKQVEVQLAKAAAPLGRPLQADEFCPVTWTLSCPEDQAVTEKVARRQFILRRLLAEAAEQGASPTVANLAEALAVSTATIKRDLAALRQAGHPFETRGQH